MTKHFTIIEVKDHKLMNRLAMIKLLDALKDGKYILEAAAHNKRSNPQNRYYWGLVVPLIQQGIKDLGTEITKEECHEFLKARFNSEELVNTETAECVNIPRSTAALNKEQFSEYIGKIQQFAAEFLSIEIPNPGMQTVFNYD